MNAGIEVGLNYVLRLFTREMKDLGESFLVCRRYDSADTSGVAEFCLR